MDKSTELLQDHYFSVLLCPSGYIAVSHEIERFYLSSKVAWRTEFLGWNFFRIGCMDLWSGYTTHQVRALFGSDPALHHTCSSFGRLISFQFAGANGS